VIRIPPKPHLVSTSRDAIRSPHSTIEVRRTGQELALFLGGRLRFPCRAPVLTMGAAGGNRYNSESEMEPRRPANVPEPAAACLDALAASGAGGAISLGGYFGLAHYLDYRASHDLGAWWTEAAAPEERKRVVEVIEKALSSYGAVRTRSWGDVVSVELAREGRVVFTFQIATRAARLEPTTPSAWKGVQVDALDDLIASKMAALVERGAPRDFRDVFAICDRGLCAARACWDLWQRRQRAAGQDAGLRRAQLAVRTHLARLEQARPLDSIRDAGDREAARRLRTWFATELLRELPD
jgi:hypothetical protein